MNFPSSETLSPDNKPTSPIRRRVLMSLGGLLLSCGALGIKARHNAQSIQYRNETLSLQGLPPELEGLRIMHITDVHIGGPINELVGGVSVGIHGLLGGSTPDNTIVLHGGDFVSREVGGIPATNRADFQQHTPPLLAGLERFPNFAVSGNHDTQNPHFETHMRGILENDHHLQFLEQPGQTNRFHYNGQEVAIHGLHIFGDYREIIPEEKTDEIVDAFIEQCNRGNQSINIVNMHHPDQLEHVLQRLREKGQKLSKKTLFFAGHAHGAMIDLPVTRSIGLGFCGVKHDRYKGWYGPEGEFLETGDWQMYVSTGVGNSPYLGFRMNADPEIVCFSFGNTQEKNPQAT